MATPNDIQQILNMFVAAFPNFKPSELTPEIYWQTLQDIPTEELKVAVLHCLTEPGRAFAPSIGEIRGTLTELHKSISHVPSAYDAWREVLTQMSENGGDHGNPIWSHSLVERVVKQLGWRNLRMSEDQTADRARFVQAYEQLLARAEREEMMLPEVRGFIEANGGVLLAPASQMKLLADKLSRKK